MNIKKGDFVRTKEGAFGKIIEIIEKGKGVRYGGERLTDKIIVIDTQRVKNIRIIEDDIKCIGDNPLKLLESGDFLNFQKILYIEQKDIYGAVALIFFDHGDFWEKVELDTLKEVCVVPKEIFERNQINLKKL